MASTEECVTLFGNAFQHWKLPSVPVSCAKALASAALGYVMILGSGESVNPCEGRSNNLKSSDFYGDYGTNICQLLFLFFFLWWGRILALLKVPQIARIVSLRSAEGLSRSMFAFEGLAYLSHAMYSYDIGLPFSAYGEAIILFSQSARFQGCLIDPHAHSPDSIFFFFSLADIALLLVMAWFKPPKLLQMAGFHSSLHFRFPLLSLSC